MQSNFEAKNIKNAKERLSKEVLFAKHHLDNYKETEKKSLKNLSIWQEILKFLKKYLGNKNV